MSVYPGDIEVELENDIFILENLRNLDKLLGFKSLELLVFPLKIRAKAAPVRAAALIK
ncbi:MAG: hypothetical protein UMU04_05185 [Halanaerobiales bacterium]|nr:hypothetical protein [Halanaerobiales bacterium]